MELFKMFTQQKIDSELTLLLSATANYQAYGT